MIDLGKKAKGKHKIYVLISLFSCTKGLFVVRPRGHNRNNCLEFSKDSFLSNNYNLLKTKGCATTFLFPIADSLL